jgi:hypothetical protein
MVFEVFQTSVLADQANPWTELMVDVCEVFQTSVLKISGKAVDTAGGR